VKKWTAAEIRLLPAVIDLITAGEILRIGRTKSYLLVKSGDFPVKVRRVDGRYKIATADICRYLEIND